MDLVRAPRIGTRVANQAGNEEIMSRSAREHDLLHAELSQVARLAVVAEMASAMAHEINQPLTAIAAYSSALQRLIGSSEEAIRQARDIAAEIGAQALRAGDVIKRIRALVKHTDFDLQPTDCNHMIRDLLILAEPLARAHRIELALELAPALHRVRADALQLQLLLLNLVHNSIEAIDAHQPQDRRIKISSEQLSPSHVQLSVTDTGGGIPSAIRESLFKPFATTKEHGTGLGLLACQRIAHAHRGELLVDDQPGIGARLSVRLPVP